MVRVLFYRCLILVCGLVFGTTAWTMPLGPVAESEMKAAYLYNFAMFTSWPTEKAAQDGPLLFCVMADEAQAGAIAALQNRKVRERTIQFRQIGAPEEVTGCHVLFLSSKVGDTALRALDAARDAAVLTVSDAGDAMRKGVVIGVALENGRLAFDVNLQGARRAGLVLSWKLLKLARSTN